VIALDKRVAMDMRTGKEDGVRLLLTKKQKGMKAWRWLDNAGKLSVAISMKETVLSLEQHF
jgi:hypothetical protein